SIKIAVVKLPKISNFTDFDALYESGDVNLFYAETSAQLDDADLIILPGSKNTIADLLYIRKSGIESKILDKLKTGTPLIAICGGYQMIGKIISDPYHVESDLGEVEGLNLVDMKTVFSKEKHTSQVIANTVNIDFLGINKSYKELIGYEIHMGETEFGEAVNHPFVVESRNDESDGISKELILGTYIHGIFDNDEFRGEMLNALRKRKGLPPLEYGESLKARKEKSYDELARVVKENLDMKKISEIMGD
ncbi:MAG: cobyric acid synthase CobQ, partial [Selenomonadaceae bacterium]|nr:cobyric acid synthase CobQ [Selenomonadaceae bacterium]